MKNRFVRLLFVSVLTVLAWVVLSPRVALAADVAPLCDERGASALAKPPVMIPAQQSLAAGFDEDAWLDRVLSRAPAAQSEKEGVRIRFEVEPVTMPSLAPLPRTPSLVVAIPVERDPDPGEHHFRVERPPRT